MESLLHFYDISDNTSFLKFSHRAVSVTSTCIGLNLCLQVGFADYISFLKLSKDNRYVIAGFQNSYDGNANFIIFDLSEDSYQKVEPKVSARRLNTLIPQNNRGRVLLRTHLRGFPAGASIEADRNVTPNVRRPGLDLVLITMVNSSIDSTSKGIKCVFAGMVGMRVEQKVVVSPGVGAGRKLGVHSYSGQPRSGDGNTKGRDRHLEHAHRQNQPPARHRVRRHAQPERRVSCCR